MVEGVSGAFAYEGRVSADGDRRKSGAGRAQAGFVDGPRVMANMAVDSWFPHRFAALSERLSMQNGVLLMSVTSVVALVYTHGDVEKLVVMYSINCLLYTSPGPPRSPRRCSPLPSSP